MEATWKFNSFNELSPVALYAILKLRSEVFVVEQDCVYLDTDDKDQASFHISGWVGDSLVAYCRVLPPGISYEDASIGRIATKIQYRHVGYGRALLKRAIEYTLERFECRKITISAQVYLKNFYESFGFVQISEIYEEDHIPHTKMQLIV